MKTYIFSFTKNGAVTARKIANGQDGGSVIYTMPEFCESNEIPIKESVKNICGKIFNKADCIIFVSACGIAVRSIAPYVKSKKEDPAVIVTDELGRYCIPILSGHIGGANMTAHRIADILNAVPVITTATDMNGKFSPDIFAVQNDMYISDMDMAKKIASAVLKGPIGFLSDFETIGKIPEELKDPASEFGVYATYSFREPFRYTLRLIPKVVQIGIGCKKNTDRHKISDAVKSLLLQYEIDKNAVAVFNSIDLKKAEKGIIQTAEEFGVPFNTYSAYELSNTDGDFSSSEFVMSVTGVDNVCERSAAIGGAKIIVPKTVIKNVALAIGVKEWRISFE